MKESNIAHHIEFMILLVTLIGGFYTLDGKIERQGQRTDKLYEMFCEMRTDYSEKFEKVNQKFYDLLKEKNNEK